MKRIIFAVFALFFAFAATAQQKQDLKVLYVGGTADSSAVTPQGVAARMEAFSVFLHDHFTEVSVIRAEDYRAELSAKHDVTIFDGLVPAIQKQITRIDVNGYLAYHGCIRLSDDFPYPAIFMAEMGDRIGRELGCKTDWYCLCLDAHAIEFNLEHPIFKGPFKTTITVTREKAPEQYIHELHSDTMPMWRVQERGYKSHKNFRVGMVSRPWGFKDSPETEIISGGVSAKGLDAIALSRHGNFFSWGFSASPRYMTEEAQAVFANAIVYMASMKGQRMIARKYYDRTATKEHADDLIRYTTRESYEQTLVNSKKSHEDMEQARKEALAKQQKGLPLSRYEQMVVSMRPEPYKPQTFEDYLKENMGDDYEVYGKDLKAYHKYMAKNKPYFYGGGLFYKLVLDEDARSWKIDNTDPKILDKAISVLEAAKDEREIAKARRILDRYTLCTFTEASDWRDWYDSCKDRLFFSQSGGWVFLVDNADPLAPGNDYMAKSLARAAARLPMANTSDRNPVAVHASHITMEGARQYILVRFTIHSGYHIYGNVSPEDPFAGTTVALELPDGYVQGKMSCPMARPYGTSGTTQYTGEALFAIPVFGDNAKEGISVKVSYQCCNPQVCLPPAEKTIELEVPAGE